MIGWTVREMFRDLFQPSGSGALSAFVASAIFWTARRFRFLLGVAGPLSIVVSVILWAILITVGFALLYLPRYPGAFSGTEPMTHDLGGRSWTVFYVSLSALTTLGSAKISPESTSVRLIAAFESLVGISLITASVTWIVLIYPALGRMRALARHASVLRRAEKQTGTDPLTVDGEAVVGRFAQAVIRMRIDFIHFPLIYYFHSDTEGASLAHSLQTLHSLGQAANGSERSEQLRLSAAMLNIALSDLAEVLGRKFVRDADSKDPVGVFRAIAKAHLERDADSANE